MIIPARRTARRISAILVAVALLAGCGSEEDTGGDAGGAGTPVAEAVADLRGPDRIAELTERAKAERGSLRLYTSVEEEIAKELVQAFTRETGVTVDLYRAKSETLAERVSKETRAGVDGADVVETNGTELVALGREGAFTPYAAPGRSALVEGSGRDLWTATRYVLFVVSRNTKAVGDDERPTTLEELGEPRWRGRVAMERDDWSWYLTIREHWLGQGLSVEEADARFERIARNSRVVEGHSFMDELVAAGEFDVAASDYSYTVETTAARGAPVSWEPPASPVVSRANGVALARTARRPAKALLFIDWLLGPGQRVLVDNGLQSARRDLAEPVDAEVLRMDEEAVVDRREEAVAAYERILRLAGKGPEEEE